MRVHAHTQTPIHMPTCMHTRGYKHMRRNRSVPVLAQLQLQEYAEDHEQMRGMLGLYV